MNFEFAILSIKPTLADKKINIISTLDLDDKDAVVELYERTSKEAVAFKTEVVNESFNIYFVDYPKVNTEYILTVRGLKSITGLTLNHPVSRRIYFKSGIVSTAEITSPAFFEQVNEVTVAVKEITTEKVIEGNEDKDGIFGNKEKVGSYYIEIAKDNAFINKVVETMFEKDSIKISLNEAGQYYIRARVQKLIEEENAKNESNVEYGNWGKTSTFTYKYNPGQKPDECDEYPQQFNPNIENDIDPIVDLEELELIGFPEQGITGESFIFEFNKPIDDLDVGDIFIIRKGIK